MPVITSYNDGSATNSDNACEFHWGNPSAIISWKPTFSLLYKIYTFELAGKTAEQQCGPDVHPSGKKPACYAQADDKKVFNQAMADAGELPCIGSECEMYLNDDEGWVNIFVVGLSSSGSLVVEENNGRLWTNFSCKYRPIDTRSDEEKAVDDLAGAVGLSRNNSFIICAVKAIKYGKIHGVKWVGE